MLHEAATDYAIKPELANLLYGVATLPAEDRRMALVAIGREHGAAALIDLFAQFIGLANSVASNASEHAQNLLVEMGQVHPYTAEKINMPSVLGALNGVQLVVGVDANKVCHGCAFRHGSIANQSLPTTMDAEQCSQPGEQTFMCHEDVDARGVPQSGCRGWAQQRAAANVAMREADHA